MEPNDHGERSETVDLADSLATYYKELQERKLPEHLVELLVLDRQRAWLQVEHYHPSQHLEARIQAGIRSYYREQETMARYGLK